jgi:hypothetical protein
MNRELARNNPRAYAILHAGMDSSDEAAFLRSLSPSDVALHVEGMLAALVQPPHPIVGGRLEPTVEVKGVEQLGLTANLYVEEEGGERLTSFSVQQAHWLKPPEMRVLLEALWKANTTQAQRSSLTTVIYACTLDAVPLNARLAIVDVLYEGLTFTHAELSMFSDGYGPDGQELEAWTSLDLHWESPDGGEARALFAHSEGRKYQHELVAWTRAITRARGWPRFENGEYVEG